jgi:hypothetical protein
MTYDITKFDNMGRDSDIKKDTRLSETTYSDSDTETETDSDTDTVGSASGISPYSILPTEEEQDIIVNDAVDEITEYMVQRALDYKREDFSSEILEDAVYSYLCLHFSDFVPHRSNYSKETSAEADSLNNVFELYLQELYYEIIERFYEEVAPPRSYPDSFIRDVNNDASEITTKLEILRAKPQPEQRTTEWYLRRNNLITASAASKAFGSQSSVNQLIYEKCKNYTAVFDTGETHENNTLIIEKLNASAESTCENTTLDDSGNKETHKVIISSEAIIPTALQQQQHVSVNSPLHWGQRYEPVTGQLYEYRNKTKLGEFGCIQHDIYAFIGASPDGINIDPNSPLYGRMVEIKNIVNRDITGIPKEEYWVQTQIQMEVCDIDETDFVETRIKEYEDEESYLADSPDDSPCSRNYTKKKLEKGIILWFQPSPVKNPNGSGFIYSMPLYEYAPLGLSQDEYDKWEQDIFTRHENTGCFWVKNIYWYVDQYSCVLILRNRLWFQAAVPVLQDLWETIEKERKTGFAHRAPKKKTTKSSTDADSTAEYVNVVKVDLTSAADTVNKTSNTVMRPSDVLIKCFKIDNLDMVDP